MVTIRTIGADASLNETREGQENLAIHEWEGRSVGLEQDDAGEGQNIQERIPWELSQFNGGFVGI